MFIFIHSHVGMCVCVQYKIFTVKLGKCGTTTNTKCVKYINQETVRILLLGSKLSAEKLRINSLFRFSLNDNDELNFIHIQFWILRGDLNSYDAEIYFEISTTICNQQNVLQIIDPLLDSDAIWRHSFVWTLPMWWGVDWWHHAIT